MKSYFVNETRVPGAKERCTFFLALLFLPFSFSRIAFVHHVISGGNPHPHLCGGPYGIFEKPILVIECGCAGLDHLKTCKFGSPIYVVVVEILFDFPYFLEPALELDIFLNPPHKGHRGVGMHIDKPRDGNHPGAVHCFYVSVYLPSNAVTGFAYFGNAAALDEYVFQRTVNGDVLEKYGRH